jgi:type I restriction enzyme, S subunit
LIQRLLTKGIGHKKFRKIELSSSVARLSIPYEWSVIELEAICKIIDTPHYTSPYYHDGIPVIRTADCEQSGQINYSQVKFTSEYEYKRRSTIIDPDIDDVLYTREAPPGIAVLVDRKKISVGQRIVLLKLYHDKVIGSYLSVFLNSDLGRKQMESMIIKTTVERINIIHIKALRIILPPLSEQRELTGTIDTIDRYDSIYKRCYFNLINLKKGLMQNLLTGKRRVRV